MWVYLSMPTAQQHQMSQHECFNAPAPITKYILSNSEVSRNLKLKDLNSVIIKLE